MCTAGFDGGHTPSFHLEVYEEEEEEEEEEARRGGLRLLAHNVTRSLPSFHLQHLRPRTRYAVVAYASNSLGREEDGFNAARTADHSRSTKWLREFAVDSKGGR